MSVIDFNDENFREHYKNNSIVVVDFWAPWCAPCHVFSPIFESVAEKHSDILFGKINTEENPKLSSHFQVRSIPTLMIIRDGIEVFYHSGLVEESQLHKLIDEAKNLDMEEVKKKIEDEAQ